MQRLLGLASLVTALTACGSAPPYPYAKEPDPRKTEYVIGVPDSLRIRVWRNAELNAEVQVRPDGTITLPLIGDLRAAGRTASELKKEITDRYGAYIRSDETTVTVEVADIASYRVTITGNVVRPGVLESSRYISVGEAISLAGGPSQFADADETVIIRTRPSGKVVRIPIRYDLIMQGCALDQDIMLLRGDLVHVP